MLMHITFEPALIDILNQQRINRGFYSLAELLELHSRTNVIFDPFSTLISRSLALGSGNIFYPNVVIETEADGRMTIGNHNIFLQHPDSCHRRADLHRQ
jgi:hypothetical protein